jgi:SecD/SecF fusion protein
MSQNRRYLFVLLFVLGLVGASAAVVATKETKLGLDLQGGARLVYQGKPTPQTPEVTQEAIDRALEIVRQRVDAFGVAEPEINRAGADQIEVNLPGVEDAERAARQVGNTAQMFFYDWEPNVLDEDCNTAPEQVDGGQQPIAGQREAVARAARCTDVADERPNTRIGPMFYAFDEDGQAFEGVLPEPDRGDLESALGDQAEDAEILRVPEGVVVVRAEQPRADTPAPDQWWVIQDEPILSGDQIEGPEQSFDQRTNEPIVTMNFTSEGRESFEQTTRAIAQRGADFQQFGADVITSSHHFAIVLDDELISKPYINFRENPDGIDGANGAQISGGFTIETAQDLAQLLKIGALPLRLEEISRSQVSATLGQQALEQGLRAGIAGFIVVALFLISFYRVLGLIAVTALATYGIYLFAIIKLIPVTLTLPGIAGLILTLGVAADSNIVIFERIKEEIRGGRSVTAGIAAGFKKGLGTIIDANAVTLLVAFVLFILATAGVKGFAFMLGIGTIISLFTAVLATQAILLSLRNTRVVRSPSALGAGEQKRRFRLDFAGLSRWFFSASGVILLAGAIAIGVGGLNFGIDFESGTRITASLERPADVGEVRNVLAQDGHANAKIQAVENEELGQNVFSISLEELGPEQVRSVTDSLDQEFGQARDPDVESIGPTFGQTVANNAWRAVLISLLVISAYIALRFQWKFTVPVLIAVMHDLLITAGIYSMTGREVTAATVAALLTILGYSLYDTIIVFDRIRENIPRMPAAAFSQIVNRSVSEVIVRSLATTFSTLLPVVALYFFGGETLQDFAFALIVGVLSGTYSSIFIATPVLAHWKQRERTYVLREQRIVDELGHVPAYAVPMAGAPVDVAPKPGRRRGPVTAPTDPSQGVSQEDFDEMVRDLGVEQQPTVVAPPRRPAGGRRARKSTDGTSGAPGDGGGAQREPKPKKPRNRKHGRPR